MRAHTLLVALTLPLSGCCSLSRLFCGPDKTPWVSVRFDTPQRTVATLLEAIRRDEPEIVYLSLADEYRKRLQLDSQVAKLAWQRIVEQNPGLHVAGYATIPEPLRLADDGATFVLDVEGTAVRIDLVRDAVWEVRFRYRDGSVSDPAEPIASWNTYARIEAVPDADPDQSVLHLGPLRFAHEGQDRVPLEAIEHAALTRRWKVANLQVEAAR